MPTIYLYLLNEGTDVWRPVDAEQISDELYRILSVNNNAGDEEWQFATHDVVRCESRLFSEGETGLVAVERVLATN